MNCGLCLSVYIWMDKFKMEKYLKWAEVCKLAPIAVVMLSDAFA